MIEIFNVNPIAEALFYYLDKANNESVKKRLEKAIRKYPEKKKLLEKAAKPAGELEKMLNSNLSVDNALVNKYFKRFGSSSLSVPFAFSLAFAMIYPAVIMNIEYSAEQMCRYFREWNTEDRVRDLCLGLTEKCEKIDFKNIGIEEFAQRIENSDLSGEDKWKILNAGINYKPHIEELLSLLMPAAKLITEAENEYNTAMKDFRKRYSDSTAQSFFNSYPNLKLKVGSSGSAKAVPLILRFDNVYTVTELHSDDTQANGKNNTLPTYRMLVGIAGHIINNNMESEELSLCEKLKVISDNTRLEMLFYLCSNRAYGQELAAKFNLRHSTISYHIAKLMSADFITAELVEAQTYYTADKAGIRRMIDAFSDKIK